MVLEIEKIDNEYPNLSNLYLSNPRIVKGGDSLILITNKEDRKLARFNTDSMIESKKKKKKDQAVSATFTNRKK